MVAKLSVTEDRAAANMLAEALNALSTLGRSRCLVDAGDPGAGIAPDASAVSEARQASGFYVVGGSAAIPDGWLSHHFRITVAQRVAGGGRWDTQAQVAAQIVSLAKARGSVGHDADSAGFTAVAAGGFYSCAIRTDGTLACWGRDDVRQASPPSK